MIIIIFLIILPFVKHEKYKIPINIYWNICIGKYLNSKLSKFRYFNYLRCFYVYTIKKIKPIHYKFSHIGLESQVRKKITENGIFSDFFIILNLRLSDLSFPAFI